MPHRIVWNDQTVKSSDTPSPTLKTRRAGGFFSFFGHLITRRHLDYKATRTGGLGQTLLENYFACARTGAGRMRVDLKQLVAFLEDRANPKQLLLLASHTGAHWSKHSSVGQEAVNLIADVKAGIYELFTRENEVKGRLAVLGITSLSPRGPGLSPEAPGRSAGEIVGMLTGEFYAHNRGAELGLLDFSGVIERLLRDKLSDPTDFYIGASIAFRQRETEIANINSYIDTVVRKVGAAEPDKKLNICSGIAYAIIDNGPFDPSLVNGIVRHNRLDASQAAKMAAHIFDKRKDGFKAVEKYVLSWLDKSGYNLEQTADFLAGLAKEMEYDTKHTAELIAAVAKHKKYISVDATTTLSVRTSARLGYGETQTKLFMAWLVNHGFFGHKRG